MRETSPHHPSLLLDVVIVVVAAALVILASQTGLEAGHPASKGIGSILGGVYLIYLGVLFLLSYFFSEACHIFIFLGYICEKRSCPAGRHMAWFYFFLGLTLGSAMLLIGLGVL
jgi:hypothetical protein